MRLMRAVGKNNSNPCAYLQRPRPQPQLPSLTRFNHVQGGVTRHPPLSHGLGQFYCLIDWLGRYWTTNEACRARLESRTAGNEPLPSSPLALPSRQGHNHWRTCTCFPPPSAYLSTCSPAPKLTTTTTPSVARHHISLSSPPSVPAFGHHSPAPRTRP